MLSQIHSKTGVKSVPILQFAWLIFSQALEANKIYLCCFSYLELMENKGLRFRIPFEGGISAVSVITQYHQNLYCSFKVLNEEGYLFTLVPTDDPFTDFQLSNMDKLINQDIDFGILQGVKRAIISHFL
jgi:hypothetical protein